VSVYKLIALYLLAILGIFVEPGFLGALGNILFKLLILGGISFLIYDVWNDKDKERTAAVEPEKVAEKSAAPSPKPIFENLNTELDSIFSQDQDFQDFLVNQFIICRRYTVASNGFLVYTNNANSGRLLYKEAPHALNPEKPNAFLALISLADKSNAILIENNLSETNSLFSFYSGDSYHPVSLLAFKTPIDAQQNLYWFFDANEADFFNTQDKNIFEKISKETGFGIVNALKNHSLQLVAADYQNALKLAKQLNRATSEQACLELISNHLIDHFEASKLTIALRKSEEEMATIEKSVGLDDPFKQGYEFSLNEGLNGWVILKNKPYLIDNIDKGEYFIPRFVRSEKTNYSLRSFLSVPIQAENGALGMITLEDKTENKYTEKDKHSLMQFADILATALGRYTEN